MKKENKTGDLKVWEWVLMVLEQYGVEGVSSDESGIEDMQVICRPKFMPWRRDISLILQKLEWERIKPGQTIYANKGQTPRKQVRLRSNTKSKRPPPIGLPRALYNPEYLAARDPDYVRNKLCVDDDSEFVWKRITEADGKKDTKGKKRAK